MPPDEIDESAHLPAGDLADLDMGFEMVEGFSRPDWKGIRAFIKDHVPKEDWETAWNEAARRWLQELAADLGGGGGVCQSPRFFCLSDLDAATTKTLLDYAESGVDMIRDCLKEAAWSGFKGKHVLLLFSDQDDYYAYVSYFYPEGTHILSAGVFLRGGYAHIALPYADTLSDQHTLAHELVHILLCHLGIPKWLNEGLAVTLQRRMAQQGFIMDPDFADRHRAHWNEGNIQTFWAGKSFNIPGDDSKLSYELGQILLNLLAGDGANFIDFVRHADWRDAGQDAALNFLNVDLGEVLGGFLGPGNWRPQRKAIADCWKQEAE